MVGIVLAVLEYVFRTTPLHPYTQTLAVKLKQQPPHHYIPEHLLSSKNNNHYTQSPLQLLLRELHTHPHTLRDMTPTLHASRTELVL